MRICGAGQEAAGRSQDLLRLSRDTVRSSMYIHVRQIGVSVRCAVGCAVRCCAARATQRASRTSNACVACCDQNSVRLAPLPAAFASSLPPLARRKPRDECVIRNGEEHCAPLIEAHKICLRNLGFQI